MAKKTAQPKISKAGVIPTKVMDAPDAGSGNVSAMSPSEAKRIQPAGEQKLIIIENRERGSSGTKLYGGYFSEDYLINELHGTAAADAYDKMRRSDAKVKMALNAVKNPIKAAHWEVQPGAPDNPELQKHAEFIDHILFHDMDKPFSKNEILTIADFGFSVFEVTHKAVLNHPKFGTYTGIKSLGWRSPRSILYWRLNTEDGSIDHVHQLATGDLQRYIDIPGDFLIVASLEKEGDNYEGISLLRACYGAWKRKNLSLKMLAIGNERNAIPTPIATIPADKQNSPQYQNLISALQNYTSHENSYMTKPEGWLVEFLKADFDPEKQIRSVEFENGEIVSAFQANFLLLGSTQSGSRAVSEDQSEFFLGGIEYVGDESLSGINHKLIPDLIKMNFGPQEAYPRVKITGISDKAGIELANALKSLAESQYIQPDDVLEDHLRPRYNLPKKSDKGVRIVQAPKAMQQGDNVITTDNPEAVEEKERNDNPVAAKAQKVQAAEFRKKRNAWRLKLAEYDTEKLQYIADGTNTCELCDKYDGRVFMADSDELPVLPIHPNCACELVPYYGDRDEDE